MKEFDYLSDIVLTKEQKGTVKVTVDGADAKTKSLEIEKSVAQSVFTEYRKKSEIADYIAEALIRRGYKQTGFAYNDKQRNLTQIEDNGGLFFLSDNVKTTGLLSVSPAVTSLMNACYGMRADGKTWEANHKYDDRINYALSYILYKINPNYQPIDDDRDDESFKGYAFDASPYCKDVIFTNQQSYLDSITWVVLALQTARRYALNNDRKKRLNLKKYDYQAIIENKVSNTAPTEVEHHEMLKELDDGILACVKMVSDMALTDPNTGRTKGWSFTSVAKENYDTTEPALYFSYVATTVYLGLYKDFQNYIELFRKLENPRCTFLTDDQKIRYWERLEEIENIKNEKEKQDVVEINQLTEELKTLSEDFDKERIEQVTSRLEFLKNEVDFINDIGTIIIENKEDVSFLMERINSGLPLTNYRNEGYFTKLKRQCLDVAEDIWGRFKDAIADHFVYPNGNIVEEKSIENSGSSNELFNGLFVCGIILNSAYDAEVKGRERDALIDTLQACVQKTQRYFDTLERRDESYKVNNYVLQFVEKDYGNSELATKLRKENIRVCSLIPMLLKMNNLVSEYVIQYPQRQMKTHLLLIMKNRMYDRQITASYKPIWLWEVDGYQSISNYYYIDALNAFYNYYEKYEKQYIVKDNDELNKVFDSVILQDKVREHIAEIRKMEATKVLENQKIIDELQHKLEEVTKEKEQGRLGSEILEAVDKHLQLRGDMILDVVMEQLVNSLSQNDEVSSKIAERLFTLFVGTIFQKVDKERFIAENVHYPIDKFGGKQNLINAIRSNISEYLVQHLTAVTFGSSYAQLEQAVKEKEGKKE